jgi:hypothetical protein
MARFFKFKTILRALVLIVLGYGVGYFNGSARPSPGYIAELKWMPLPMNEPHDVSEIVRPHLPEDGYEAFELVAESSTRFYAYHNSDCDCPGFILGRLVTRTPLPRGNLSVYFEARDGRLTYSGASVVEWFL